MRYLRLALILAGSAVMFYFSFSYLLPFILAMLLALLVDPPVNLLETRAGIPRGLATALALVVVLGVFFTVAAVVVARLAGELRELLQLLPLHYRWLLEGIEGLYRRWEGFRFLLPPEVWKGIDGQLGNLFGYVEKLLIAALQAMSGLFTGLPGLLAVGLISMVAAFFFSRDKRLIQKFLLALLPPETRGKALQVQSYIMEGAFGLARAQLALVGITTAIATLGFFILGVEYALLLGLLTGLLDILPLAGPSSLLVPWAAWSWLAGEPGRSIQLLVLLLLISIARQINEARLVGKSTGLHPLAVLLSLYVGFRIFGPAGLLIGPLVAVVLKGLIRAGVVRLEF